MAWKFFQKSKERLHNPQQKGSELEMKINTALKNAEDDRAAAVKEIEQIKNWAAEIIVDTYADVFPNGNLTYYKEQYKEDALEKFDQIQSENKDKVGEEKAEKCNKIVHAYLTQIKLRKSKLQLYDKLVGKYEEVKNKLDETKKTQSEENKIHKHEERIKVLDGADNEYVDAATDTAKFEELEKEFELKNEYANQLNQLNEKYKETENVEDYTTSLAFKDEIDKMIDEID
ncbi:MAG: hypothetical protein DRI94_02820 [Bacteroidetes bacterium]|nr:MAG: hypothetical protein DRI94_02820 [Bacteroidota bacterium]